MLRLDNVSKYYHSNDVVALGLRKVSLEFKLGEFIAVTGESGSGKSTLLNVISGLDTYEDGEMYINGEETSYFSIDEWETYRRQYIGFVFQSYNIIDSYSVYENVLVALQIQGYDPLKRKERALELIRRVGLESHTHHKASKLSGGQKQRAVIARALAKDCPVIVCDEPTGNLDSESSKTIIELLKEISEDKLVIVVTHNYDEVKDYATRRIRLFDGEVVEDKVLRKRANIEESTSVPSYRMSFWNLVGMSTKNLFRTPRRSIFSIIVTMFVVLAFALSFGVFKKNQGDTGNYYGSDYFQNVIENRVIVTKFDDSVFSLTELQALRNIDNVMLLIEHDVLLDFAISAELEEYDWTYYEQMYLTPAVILKDRDLRSGRLPLNANEVVVDEGMGYKVGDQMESYYAYGGYYYDEGPGGQTTADPDLLLEVVGVSKDTIANDWRYRVYVHEDFFKDSEIIGKAYISGRSYISFSADLLGLSEDAFSEMNFWNPTFVIDNTLADDEIKLSYDFLNEAYFRVHNTDYNPEEELITFDLDFHVISSFFQRDKDLSVVGMEGDPEKYEFGKIAVNQNLYDELTDIDKYQVTLIVADSFDANKVIDIIEADGYNAIYPSGVETYNSIVSNIISGIWFGVLMVLLMTVVYFVSYLVLRNIQFSKKKDYLIFRSIGASKNDLNKVTIIELFQTVTISFIIVYGILYFNEIIYIYLPQQLKYYTIGNYVFVLLIMYVLALLLGFRFNRKIFGDSVITSLKQE